MLADFFVSLTVKISFMDNNNTPTNQIPPEEQSLETPDTIVEQKASGYTLPNPDSKPVKKPFKDRFKNITNKLNVYLLLFVLLVVMTLLIAYVAYNSDKKAATDSSIRGQILSESALSSLSANNTTVGDSKQTLTIASNSIFNGRVLIRENLDVAGTIKVGGALSLTGLTVANTSNFETVQIANSLSIAGDSAIRGSLTLNGTLSAAGGASFGGPVTAPAFNVSSLNLNQDLTLSRHIKTEGIIPPGNFTPAGTTANGTGGTFTGNGTDIAGTADVKIGTGASCSPSGTLIGSVKFLTPYSSTPSVIITPVGGDVGALRYYVTRTNTGFSIGCTGGIADSKNFSFDYIVIQ